MSGSAASSRPRETKHYDASTSATTLVKAMTLRPHSATPHGRLLEILLATFYSPVTQTGILNPTPERLLAMTGWNERQLMHVVDELESTGAWQIMRSGSGRPLAYLPSFYDAVAADAPRIKSKVRGTKDHAHFLARYGREDGAVLSTIQRLAFILALATIEPKWHLLGSKSEGRNRRYKTTDGKSRLIYGVMFKHPIINDKSDAGNALLANCTRLPDDIDSFSANITTAWLATKTGVTEAKLIEHLRRPQPYFQVEFRNAGANVQITPTWLFHQRVWELNRDGGGAPRNTWEYEHGYYPVPAEPESTNRLQDLHTCRPPLGFHTIYVLTETLEDGMEVPILVGQTTQPLERRLSQHLQDPSNATAYNYIKNMIRRGSLPRIHPVQLASYANTSDVEMGLARELVDQGATLLNMIMDPEANRRTVVRDSRFDGTPEPVILSHLGYWANRTPPAFLFPGQMEEGDQLMMSPRKPSR